MSNLIDVLSDVVAHTLPFKLSAGVRIDGTDTNTAFKAVDNVTNCRITMTAEARIPIPEFVGNFGLPGFALKSLKASLAEAKNVMVCGTIGIKVVIPEGATTFPLKTKDLPKHISEKPGAIKWEPNIIQPLKSVVDSFSKCSALLPKADQIFRFRTDRGRLKFILDEGEITTELLFAKNVKTKINPAVYWYCDDFLKVLKLAVKNKSSIRITNQGVIGVSIDTGLVK